ncbi:MAG: hypothetical protein JKY94_10025 [Rhodobacteraceae bacterium]|nr:hypothetical protein [Paracoccaceae bacterium]
MSEAKPIFPPSKAVPLDDLYEDMRQRIDLEGIDAMMIEMDPQGDGSINDGVAMFLYGMAVQPQGKKVLEWFCDLTVRRFDMARPASLEQAAMDHCRQQERNALMMMICAAVVKGQKLAESKEETTK